MTAPLKIGIVSKLVGYKGRTQVFRDWKEAGHDKRVLAVQIGAEFISRGYELKDALMMFEDKGILIEEMLKQEKELSEVVEHLKSLTS